MRNPVATLRARFLAFSVLVGAACTESEQLPVAAKLAFITQPTTAAVGQILNPVVSVAVQDAGGHIVTTASNDVTLQLAGSVPGAQILGTLTRPAVNGVASFPGLQFSHVGTGFTLSATSGSLAGATSQPFEVHAGLPAKLGFLTQPGPVTAGVPMTVAVAIQDAAGNTVLTATSSVNLAIGGPAGATFTGPTNVLAFNGVATFPGLVIDKADAGYTLTATTTTLAGVTSNPFSVAPGPASRLAFTVHPSSTVPGGVIQPAVTVSVHDLGANLITTGTHQVTLAFGNNPGGGSLSGTLTRATVNGVATFDDLSITNAGTGYTLVASAPGLVAGSSALFHIRTPLVLASITAGYFHSCGVAPNGMALCWGSNSGGQLGAGSAAASYVDLPTPVTGGFAFSSVVAGRDHTCGLIIGGAGSCWGPAHLGAGNTTLNSTAPAMVAGGFTFARIAAAYDHSCGVTTSGVGYCWGFNGSGELGNGTTVNATSPVVVAGSLTFANIGPGRSFTCGVTTGAAAYCWGNNLNGWLGNGTTTNSLVPVLVSGALSWAMAAAGGFHSCGLTTAGAAYCWGANDVGQLGSGPGAASSTPKPVSGGIVFVSLSVGNRHTCGVTANGTAYCWGDGSTGMLGTGNTANFDTPVLVTGGHTWAMVSAGRFHSCGVTTGGAAYCWGSGSARGTGTAGMTVIPTRVF